MDASCMCLLSCPLVCVHPECSLFSIFVSFLFFFFFSSRRRHTRSTRDWSSDVCSSDLDHHGRLVDLEPDLRQAFHARARRDDHGLLRFVRIARDLHLASGQEHATAFDDGDLVLLHEELDALRVLVAHFAGALHRDAIVGLDGTGFDAELLRLPQQPRDVGGMEQGLCGDAPDVDAHAAELLFLDHGRAHTELGRADGGDVAGGPSPKDDDVKLTRQKPPSLTRNAERGTGRPTLVRLFRVPRSAFRVHSSIASGCSNICFSVWRNAAPVAPSITRWSQLIVRRMRRRAVTWPSSTTAF